MQKCSKFPGGISGREQGKVVGNQWKLVFPWFFGNCERSNLSQVCARIRRGISVFRLLSCLCFSSKTNLPLHALELSPGTSEAVWGGQGREDQYTPGMTQQAVGRAAVWLQGLASQSQAVIITIPSSLCLLHLLSPTDTSYEQHGKSLIVSFTCLVQWGES